MKSQEKRVVKHPDKWRETIDPFSLAYKSFHPIEILGYPHAGNDVFHARGIYKGKEVRAYIKAARQKGAAIENEVAILSQLHSPIYPTVLDCGFAGTPFSVTLELPGERLSTIVGENETLESLSFMEEYGATLATLHQLRISGAESLSAWLSENRSMRSRSCQILYGPMLCILSAIQRR
mgnify:CR=1 FL=1